MCEAWAERALHSLTISVVLQCPFLVMDWTGGRDTLIFEETRSVEDEVSSSHLLFSRTTRRDVGRRHRLGQDYTQSANPAIR